MSLRTLETRHSTFRMWTDDVQANPQPVETGKLNSTSYKDVIELVKNHYDPKPSVTMQRHKFNMRVQAPGESIARYVAALRQLAEFCDYKDTLNDMIKDRLVCGINNEVSGRS